MKRRTKDRAEITELMHRYAWAIDQHDFDALDAVFTPDALLDYSSNPGGIAGSLAEVKPWLRRSLSAFVAMQHLMANTIVEFGGKSRARATTMVFNPMSARAREGAPHHFRIGGRYDDELVRTPHGWRIAKRVETLLFLDGSLPPELVFPDDATAPSSDA
jgi:hypothetical protein